ncbi:hypothetical protein Ga0100231_023785 [Opitutaceae bacterium TAV4]|nr:hypothetical protein Ga0100231_023785 [Opitutaceae bacterium TAV4]RRK00896.1 hypothetical protein Ga0100230_024290 [Opitutaceae bacterium TAV3]
MTPSAFLIFNRWLIRELLNALLRPVYLRAGCDSLRFLRLLDACDCYPFCVEVGGGLWILDAPSDDFDDFRC